MDYSKIWAVVFVIGSLLLGVVLSQFLANIEELNFMSFQIGMSLFYPACVQIFFGKILKLLNLDLLSKIKFFNIDFEPRYFLVGSHTESLGFIDFESKNVILILNTMIWMILSFVIQLIIVGVVHRRLNICKIGKVRTYFENQHKSLFYNGIIEYL